MRKKHSVGVAIWLLAAGAVVGLAWFWWHWGLSPNNTGAPKPPGNAQSSRAATQTNGPSPVASESRQARQDLIVLPTNVASIVNTSLAATNYPRPVQSVFEMQVALARNGLSCGSIDGFIGPQTRAALRSLQLRENLPVTGELDSATCGCLLLTEAPVAPYQVSSNDLTRLQPLSSTWLGKSQQNALEYESLLELVSEKTQAHPALVSKLNPDLNWARAEPGTIILLPNVTYPSPSRRAASVTIRLSEKILQAWDDNTNLLAHFPCSIARRVEKRPVGELHVAVIAHNPNYTFDPENFPESAEARELGTKLVLPPGPNNPVGVAWIGLDKPGYGIHGTPNPEQVGRTESHGCFRLANWNAEYLARLVEIGTPVYVQP